MIGRQGARAVAGTIACLAVGGGCPTLAADCPGETASALDVAPGETVTLNCGGGLDDPLEEALIVFTNGPASEPASVTVCEIAQNPYPGDPGYAALERTLAVEVAFAGQAPGNTYLMRVMLPFDGIDLPPGDAYGPEATDPVFHRAAGWVLAVADNMADSPGYADGIGDRTTVVGTAPPAGFSDEAGDYGVFWHTDELRGFVWANVDHDGEFAAGAPLCWEDFNGDTLVTAADLVAVLNNFGLECVVPPMGCLGDIFFDGVVDMRDVARVLAFWEYGTCYLPPDGSAIVHSAHQVDNTAGDEEWEPGSAMSTHLTWDLRVAVEPPGLGDAWTTSTMYAALDDPVYDALAIYQHHFQGPLGAPPTTGVCYFFPAAEFDSFVIEATDVSPCTIGSTIPGAWPDSPYTETATEWGGAWFDWADFDAPDAGDPPFTIARITILVDVEDVDCPACHLDLRLVESGAGGVDPVLGRIEGVTTHRYGLSRRTGFAFDLVDHCAADVNGDGVVRIEDLLQLLADWSAWGTPADVDRDGLAGIADFLTILAAWGPCP